MNKRPAIILLSASSIWCYSKCRFGNWRKFRLSLQVSAFHKREVFHMKSTKQPLLSFGWKFRHLIALLSDLGFNYWLTKITHHIPIFCIHVVCLLYGNGKEILLWDEIHEGNCGKGLNQGIIPIIIFLRWWCLSC